MVTAANIKLMNISIVKLQEQLYNLCISLGVSGVPLWFVLQNDVDECGQMSLKSQTETGVHYTAGLSISVWNKL